MCILNITTASTNETFMAKGEIENIRRDIDIIEMRQKLSRSPLSVRNESMNSTVQTSLADIREASSTMRIIGFGERRDLFEKNFWKVWDEHSSVVSKLNSFGSIVCNFLHTLF